MNNNNMNSNTTTNNMTNNIVEKTSDSKREDFTCFGIDNDTTQMWATNYKKALKTNPFQM